MQENSEFYPEIGDLLPGLSTPTTGTGIWIGNFSEGIIWRK
jgi:hypothetical protein